MILRAVALRPVGECETVCSRVIAYENDGVVVVTVLQQRMRGGARISLVMVEPFNKTMVDNMSPVVP